MTIVRGRYIAGLAAAQAVVVLSGCTAHSPVGARGATGASPEAPSASVLKDTWITYHQPPGPMRLSFKHPASWKASGSTFEASMGNVGIAYLEHDLSGSVGASPTASSNCRVRARAIRGHGVLVVWSASLDSPNAAPFSETPGQRLTVHGWPARLQVSTISTECAGNQLSHVPERVVTGAIEEGRRTVQRMYAVMGIDAGAKTLATVRRIFISVQQ